MITDEIKYKYQNNPEFRCLVGQLMAIAKGDNMLSVEDIIDASICCKYLYYQEVDDLYQYPETINSF